MQNDEASSTSGVPNPLDFNTSSQFSLHEELPSKGYCRLFKAQRYGKWYVLKCLRTEHVADPVYMAMLEKEFDAAVTLDHPNIVHTYSLENDEVAGCCFVMEYVEGRTLAQFLGENPSTAKRKQVVLQLLDAMEYFHARQIVHRDLKPSNILVTYNGDNVKVIDFGLADADDYAVLKEPAYTDDYAAPEQMTAGPSVDCRTDIYAFGILLRQLFPHRYKSIIRRCTRTAQSARYPSAAAVRKAILRHDAARRWIPLSIVVLAIASVAVFFVPKHQESVSSENTSDTSVPLQDSSQNAVVQTISSEVVQSGAELPETVHLPIPTQPTDNLAAFRDAKAKFKAFGDSINAIWMKNVADGTYDTHAKADLGKRYLEMLIMERKELLLMDIPIQTEDEYERYFTILDKVRISFIASADNYMETHPFSKPDDYDDPDYMRLCDMLQATCDHFIKVYEGCRQRRLGSE